jgi:pyruvate/2-oxoglutarate dehydrogenase complex dihydrolipoamide acyltransferase (E2) component
MPHHSKFPRWENRFHRPFCCAWLKKDGDAVAVDDPVAELETDKANLEMPSPGAGVLPDQWEAGRVHTSATSSDAQ